MQVEKINLTNLKEGTQGKHDGPKLTGIQIPMKNVEKHSSQRNEVDLVDKVQVNIMSARNTPTTNKLIGI